MTGAFVAMRNEQSVSPEAVPVAPFTDWREAIVSACGLHPGERLAVLTGWPVEGRLRLLAVLANDREGQLRLAAAEAPAAYASLTPDCPQAHWFEREIAEQWGLRPEGHPWLKPIRFQPGRGGLGVERQIGRTDFFRVEGEEVHEVAVGPVHAGVIEPGHFRFQCHGERVLHLEISLGYQHRGVERAMNARPGRRAIHYMETLAGDSTIAHASAYCQAVEAAARVMAPPRGLAIRALALELERIANHIGDLGALAGDVGYLPTASFCGRIRGDALNATALVCGNRFGRGLVRPGGVAWDLDAARARELGRRVAAIERDAAGAVGLLWDSPSVMARFEGTGVVSRQTCEEVGLVGVAARACGVGRDARKDHPFGMYRYQHIPACTWASGDVFARAYVRWAEIERSCHFIQQLLDELPGGAVRCEIPPPVPGRLAVGLVEGWRGEVCHVLVTGADGEPAFYKVVDPSFHNWFGLACALKDQQISDFPLCNKSFNLSYCGHDL